MVAFCLFLSFCSGASSSLPVPALEWTPYFSPFLGPLVHLSLPEIDRLSWPQWQVSVC